MSMRQDQRQKEPRTVSSPDGNNEHELIELTDDELEIVSGGTDVAIDYDLGKADSFQMNPNAHVRAPLPPGL